MPTKKDSKRKTKTPAKVLKETINANFPELVDIVLTDDNPSFLLCNPYGQLVTKNIFSKKNLNQVLVPPPTDRIPFILVSYKSVDKVKYDIDKLYNDVVGKLSEVSKLPSDSYCHLCAVYIFFTYLNQLAQNLPYLWFHGLPERGKSRIVKAMSWLVYRGFYTETLNPAPLFRFSNGFHGTILLDLYDIEKEANRKGAHDFLLGRYDKGMKVARVTNIESGPYEDTQYFDVSGPTIIATNVQISYQNPLRSRCFQIVMPEARGKYRNLDHETELLPLKAELLHFRAKYMNKPLPDIEKPVSGRLGDMMHPLFAVARLLPDEATIKLESIVEEFKTARNESELESVPGQIIEILYSKREEGESGKLRVAEVCDLLNDNRYGHYPLTPQEIGINLATMGIERRKSKGTKYIIWDNEVINGLFTRYGLGE